MKGDLITAGALLYGRRWQTDMAPALGVSRRTVVNWVKGIGAPSDDHWSALRERLCDRLNEIEATLREWP